jgi:hypothetical protein
MKRIKYTYYENLPMTDKMPIWYNMETELERLKVNIGVDKLKLCYTVENNSIIRELEEEKPNRYYLLDFELHRIEEKYHRDTYQIIIQDVNEESGKLENAVYGKLFLNFKLEDENKDENGLIPQKKKVWFSIENRMLYNRTNMPYVNYIARELGLTLHNVTELEIFIDSTKRNIPYLLKRMIRYDGYITFLNGKAINNRKEDRDEIAFLHSGDMDRYKYMTLYIQSLKAKKNKLDGITISSYNKRKECMNSKKNYILEKYGNPKKLYRTEVRVGNEKFKEFIGANNIELHEFLFMDKGFLYTVFEWFFNKVIYFRNTGSSEVLNIVDFLL